MSLNSLDQYPDLQQAAERAEHTAKRWAQLSTAFPPGRAERLLAAVLQDPDGLAFTVGFVDGVIRPEDEQVAAKNLRRLVERAPASLPTWLRMPAWVGGNVGILAPEIVIPVVRQVFARLVGDLVLDVDQRVLGPAIAKLRADGSRLNVNLLGEAVLGEEEASRRLTAVFELLRRDDIDYVSLKVSSVTGPHNPWAYQEVVAEAVRKLLPLYQYAAEAPTKKFINLDMEEYRDFHLTIDVFESLLDRDELLGLEAGIVIQSYLPDALDAFKRLSEWAKQRVSRGGAPIKVRLVKGANLAMERVDAELHGWPRVTWESRQATDANYLRILDWALTPENTRHVRVGVAGHNLFTLALAWELADLRGVREAVDIEMLAGMATSQAQAIRTDVGSLLLYVPVVNPDEFDVALAYLVRRLEENAAPENFMSSVFEVGADPQVFEKERNRFRRAVKQATHEGDKRCHPNRSQNRSNETLAELTAAATTKGFHNVPDTDPTLPANRRWARAIASRIAQSKLGVSTVQTNRVGTQAELDRRLDAAIIAGATWRERPVSERAEILRRVGVELGRRRADLIEAAAAELGKGIEQTDVEVSEAIDFANYYAEQSLQLNKIPGASFRPVELSVVASPWNFPLAIPLGGVTAALAAGSAVVLKPASIASRCGAVLAECLWAAGVDANLAQLVVPGNREVARALIEDRRVDRLILTGSWETAEMFLRWRPDLTVLAETSGKNAIVVTPSADLDLAVRDVVASAFGHAGQKCSAASLVILVGSVGKSRRFRSQLLDATRSLRVGWGEDLSTQMSVLSEVPGGKLRAGLTELEAGQSWALQPECLDNTGRMWSPGIRSGVEVNSEFHRVEYFGPVLGVVKAATLEEALEIQNGVDFGLTAGLQSLAADEINYWVDRVEAGNLYINRVITGAIVQRQPFGGWKLSSVGPGAKAGGPNYLFGFGSFEPVEARADDAHVAATAEPTLRKMQLLELVEVARLTLEPGAAKEVERAAHNAEQACALEFDRLGDLTGLSAERNIFRYLPTRAVLRAERGVPLEQVLMVMAAAVATGEYRVVNGELTRVTTGQGASEGDIPAPRMLLTTAEELPPAVYAWAERYGFTTTTESTTEFQDSLLRAESGHDCRVRLLGQDRAELMTALGGSVDVAIWDGPATTAGRVEALPFVHEQSISMVTHRFGTPSSLRSDVLSTGVL